MRKTARFFVLSCCTLALLCAPCNAAIEGRLVQKIGDSCNSFVLVRDDTEYDSANDVPASSWNHLVLTAPPGEQYNFLSDTDYYACRLYLKFSYWGTDDNDWHGVAEYERRKGEIVAIANSAGNSECPNPGQWFPTPGLLWRMRNKVYDHIWDWCDISDHKDAEVYWYFDVSSEFACAPSFMYTPDLTGPEDNSVVPTVGSSLTLSWSYTTKHPGWCDCAKFQVRLGASSTATDNPIVAETTDCSQLSIDVTAPSTPCTQAAPAYYWAISAVPNHPHNAFSDTATSNSATRSFCIPKPPSSPELLLPNTTYLQVNTPVTFSWRQDVWGFSCSTTTPPALFTLLVVCDSVPIINENVQATATDGSIWSYSVDPLVSSPVACTWSVSMSFGQTASSVDKSFTVCQKTAPSPPAVVSPQMQEKVIGKNALIWDLASWGDDCPPSVLTGTYKVYLSQDTKPYNFNPVAQGLAVANLSLATIQSDSLGFWYWCIRATNNLGLEVLSPVFSFYACKEVSPDAPEIYEPEDAAAFSIAPEDSSITVTFFWNPVDFGSLCDPIVGTYRLVVTAALSGDVIQIETSDTSASVVLTDADDYTFFVVANNSKLTTAGATGTLSVCKNLKPGKPTATSPGASVVGPDVTLEWSATDEGTSCSGTTPTVVLLYLSQDSALPDVAHVASFSDSSYVFTGLAAGTYYYAVQVKNNELWSDLSDAVSFVVCNVVKPSGFSYSLPQSTTATTAIGFEWSAPNYGTSCVSSGNSVSVAVGQTTSSLVTTATVIAPATTTTINVASTGVWYFQFTISNGDSAVTTPIFRTIVGSSCTAALPEQPQLSLPAANAIATSIEVELSWLPTFVGDDCSGSAGTFQVLIDGSVALTGITLTSATVTFPSAGTHSWAVRAVSGSNTATSSPRSICVAPPPSTPVLLAPIDNATVVYPFSFSWDVADWTAACGATKKTTLLLDYSEYATFTDDGATETTSGTPAKGAHVWTIIAEHQSSSFAPVELFTVCEPVRPQSPKPLLPAEEDLTVPPLNFTWMDNFLGDGCKQGAVSYKLLLNGENYTADEPILAFDNITAGTYTWRVMVFNGALWSTFTVPITFTHCIPSAPRPLQLLSPRNGTVGAVLGLNTFLSWNQTVDDIGIACLIDPAQDLKLHLRPAGSAFSSSIPLSFPTTMEFSLMQNESWYEWWLTLGNGRDTTESERRWYRVCRPVPPSNLTLLTPEDGARIVAYSQYVELSWSLGSFGDPCSDTAVPKFEIMLAKNEDPVAVQSVVDGTEFSSSVRLRTGNYSLAIRVRFGAYTAMSAVHRISVCVPGTPTAARILSPANGAVLLRNSEFENQTFAVQTSAQYGRSCGTGLASSNGYRLLFGRTSLDLVETVSVPSNYSAETVEFAFNAMSVANGEWVWTVETFNTDNVTTRSNEQILTICENPRPTSLMYPANNTMNVSTSATVLTWRALASSDWGLRCFGSEQPAYRIYYMPFAAGQAVYAEMDTFTSVPYTVSSLQFSEAISVLPNTTYAWQVAVFNGGDQAKSEIFYFTTVERDCSSIDCGEHGTCAEATITCVCHVGWSGEFCEFETRSKTGPIVAGVLGGLFLLLLIAGIIFVLIILRRRRRRLHLAPPSEDLRYFVCKAPTDYHGDPLGIEPLIQQDGRTFNMAVDLAASAKPTEADSLATALVYAYERNGTALPMLKAVISAEVAAAANPETLLRANSMATKMFKVYSKLMGLQFLFQVFGKVLEELLQKELDVEQDDAELEEQRRRGRVVSVRLFSEGQHEVDPDRMSEEDMDDLALNMTQLCLTAQKFITQIFRSVQKLPVQFKEICAQVHTAVLAKFGDPHLAQSAVGAFLFLRFFNVAVSVPESYGLLKEPPKDNLRRILVLVAKILQNLSTETLPGAKETFMSSFASLLQSNFPQLEHFYQDAVQFTAEETLPPAPIPDDLYRNALCVVDSHHHQRMQNCSHN